MSEEKKQPQDDQNQDPLNAQEALGEASSPDPSEAPGAEDNAHDADPVAELKEALLRTRAEMDNLEKRTQREIERARKFMFEGIFKDLLPVLDGLDLGLQATGADVDGDDGLALTRRGLLQALQKHGLEMIDPAGEPFDPEWHEAMSAQPNEEVPAQTVLMVMQKGYRLNDRLLRPARVVISTDGA